MNEKKYQLEKLRKDVILLNRCIQEKWLPILHLQKNDLGGENCALCKEYPGCRDCPIYLETQYGQCACTPYDQWIEVAGKGATARTLSAKKAALDMTCYLDTLARKLDSKRKVLEEEDKAKELHPYIFYATLKESVDKSVQAASFRLALQDKIIDLLKKEGLRVGNTTYQTHPDCIFRILNKKTGGWQPNMQGIKIAKD